LDFGERHEKKRLRGHLRARLRTTANCRCSDEQDNGNFKATEATEARFFAIEHHQSDRLLERQSLLERDAENGYLAGDAVDGGPMDHLLGHSITYRIAVGPHAGRKVFTEANPAGLQ
jgi:hypothetical protein